MVPPISVSASPARVPAALHPILPVISTPTEAGEYDYLALGDLSVKCTNSDKFESVRAPVPVYRGKQLTLGDITLDGVQDNSHGVGVIITSGPKGAAVYFAKGGLCDIETSTTRMDLYLPDSDPPKGVLYSILVYPVRWQVPAIIPGAANPARVSQNLL